LRAAYSEFQGLDAELIALSSQPLLEAQQAALAASLPYPIVSDPTLTVIDSYGVRHPDEPEGREIARPSVFIIDRQGVVRFAHVGEHTRDRPTPGALLLASQSLS
jgi:peroxiredoxin